MSEPLSTLAVIFLVLLLLATAAACAILWWRVEELEESLGDVSNRGTETEKKVRAHLAEHENRERYGYGQKA